MHCPKCMSETFVITTNYFTDGIRRRHACRNPECKHRFNTAQVLYGRPFAVCKGKRMRRINGKWETAKSIREMQLLQARAKRARFTKEQRLEFIRRSLFPSHPPAQTSETGEQHNG